MIRTAEAEGSSVGIVRGSVNRASAGTAIVRRYLSQSASIYVRVLSSFCVCVCVCSGISQYHLETEHTHYTSFCTDKFCVCVVFSLRIYGKPNDMCTISSGVFLVGGRAGVTIMLFRYGGKVWSSRVVKMLREQDRLPQPV